MDVDDDLLEREVVTELKEEEESDEGYWDEDERGRSEGAHSGCALVSDDWFEFLSELLVGEGDISFGFGGHLLQVRNKSLVELGRKVSEL